MIFIAAISVKDKLRHSLLPATKNIVVGSLTDELAGFFDINIFSILLCIVN